MLLLDKALAADAAVAAGENRKFPAYFRAGLVAARATLAGAERAIDLSEGERTGASTQLKADRKLAGDWARSVFARIEGLPPGADKSAILISYGFKGGKLGALGAARLETLLADFPTASTAQTLPAARLPAEWIAELNALRARIEANKPLANIATRGERVAARDRAREVAEDLVSRLLGFLTFSLPMRDQDKAMNAYGFTPRQNRRPTAPAPPVAPPSP